MFARVFASLCIVAFVAGCASPARAPRDQAGDPKAQEQLQKSEAERKRFFSAIAQAAANARIKELKTQLDLTAEQESGIRKAYMQPVEQLADNSADGFALLLKLGALPFHSERDFLKPLLTPEQLEAYDAYETQQRKEMVLATVEVRANPLDSHLSLTGEQRNEVCEIFAISTEQWLEGLDNNQFAALTNQENAMLSNVLTPSQFKRYQNLCRYGQPQAPTFFFPAIPIAVPRLHTR